MNRPSKRASNALRPLRFTRQYSRYAEGSVLTELGHTKVLCNVSVIDKVPKFLRGTGKGWLTAEYGMLPRATHQRTDREAVTGKTSGRTAEIQRLIGRSLRSMLDLSLLGERTLWVDCDVLDADGSTRTAAISGAALAVVDALNHLQKRHELKTDPLKYWVAAVSVGLYRGAAVLDLDYAEDSQAGLDLNVVMNQLGQIVDVQGTAESTPCEPEQMTQLLLLAREGINHILEAQQKAFNPH